MTPALPEARAAARSAWARDVIKALDRLDPLQREALQLVYFQRCSLEDAASRLSLSASALSTRVSAGMQALGSALS